MKTRSTIYDRFDRSLNSSITALHWCWTLLCLFALSGLSFAQQISGSSSTCQGQSETYTLIGATGNYDWNVSGGSFTSTSINVSEVTVLWNQSGSGSLTASSGTSNLNHSVQVLSASQPVITETQALSCNYLFGRGKIIIDREQAVRDTREETLGTLGEVALGGSYCLQACERASFTYYTPEKTGSTYVWQVTGATSFTVSGNEITVEWGTVGTGTLSITETNANGCVSTSATCVNIVPAPTAGFTALPNPVSNIINVCRNQAVSFFDQSIDAVNWSWDFGDGTNSYLQNPSHSFTAPGTYQVVLTVSNGLSNPIPIRDEIQNYYLSDVSCNCSSTFTMTVVVAGEDGPVIECISTLCGDESATYSTPANCSNYNWSIVGGTITSTDGNAVTVDWGNNTSAQGYLTLDVGNCAGYCPVPTTAVIPIVPTTTTITGDEIVCFGSARAYVMPQMPGVTYYWSVSGGTIIDGNGTNQALIAWSPSAYESGYQTITVEYENEILSCSGTAELEVYIAPDLDIINTSFAQICEDQENTNAMQPITLVNAFDNSPIIGNWTLITPTGQVLTDVITNSATFEPFAYSYGAGSYTLIASPVAGIYCNDQMITSVFVQAQPATPAGINGAASICPGSTQNYAAIAGGAVTYDWSITGGTITTYDLNAIIVDWDAVGPYSLTVTVTGAGGCVSEPYTMQISPLATTPAPNVSGLSEICLGGQSTYSYAGAALPGVSYAWSINPPELGNIITPLDANNAQVSWSDNNQVSATANVILTITDECGNVSTSSLAVNLSGFTVDFALPTICVETEFAVSNTTGVYQEWTFGGGASSTDATATHTYDAIGTYPITLYVVDANNCEASVSKLVDVHPTPIAKITTPSKTKYCPEELIEVELIALNNSGANYDYAWYQVGSPSSFATGNSTTVNALGSYYAVFTNEYGCTATSDTINVSPISCDGNGCQIEAHSADFTSTVLSCATLQFVPNNSANIRPTSWSFEKNGTSYSGFISNDESPSFTFAEAGYYTIWMNYRGPKLGGPLGDSSDCFITRQVLVPAAATFEFSFSCPGNVVQTQLTDLSVFFAPATISSHEWFVDGLSVSTDQNPLLNLTAGSHVIRLEIVNSYDNTVCSTEQTVIVPANVSASYTHTEVSCPGSVVNFTNTSTGDEINQWNWNFTNGISSSSVENPVRQLNAPGSYDATLTVTSLYGCSDETTQTLVVGTPENGTIAANGPLEFCQGDEVVLTAPAGSNYLWSTGETTASITVNESGAYDVRLSGGNGCSYTTAAISVNVLTPGIVTLTGNSEICSTARVYVEASSGFQSYQWSYEQAPYGGIVNSFTTSSNIFNRSLVAGTYLVSVVATSSNGCQTESAQIEVLVKQTPERPIIGTEAFILCEGSNNVLTIANPETGASYYWSTGQTGTSITVTQASTYSVTVDNGNGCPAVAKNTVIVRSAPDVSSFMSGCYEFCDDEKPVYLYGLGGFGGTGEWFSKEGNLLTSLGFASTYAVTESGTYVLVSTNLYGCQAQTDPITIDFLPLPEVLVSIDQDVLCEGSEATLTAYGADSYEWFSEVAEYTCTGNQVLADLQGLTNALALNDELVSTSTEVDLVNNSDYNPFLPSLEPFISLDNNIVWSISSGGLNSDWWIYSQTNYNSYIELRVDKLILGTSYTDLNTIASIQNIRIDPTYTNGDGTNNHFIIEAVLDNSTVVELPGTAYEITSSGQFINIQEEISLGTCTRTSSIGTGESITLNLEQNVTYYVVGTNDETGCSSTVEIPLDVLPFSATATIDCCEDESICAGTATSIEVTFTGAGPWTFTYSDGVANTSVTTSDNPYTLALTPTMTTTYTLVSVSGATSGGCTEVCGKATVGVTDCTPIIATGKKGKGRKVQDCSENCFNTTVVSVVDSGEACKTVTLRVTCNNSCQAALSHYSVSIPCGTITSMSNTLGFQMGSVHPDPTSGITGFKVDNIQRFCEDHETSTFDVTYTVCSSATDCGNGDFCAPLVSYKSGTCVNYGIATNPSNYRNNVVVEDGQDAIGEELVLNVYPNPFHSSTRIALNTPTDASVDMTVYDLNGKKMALLYEGNLKAGTSVFAWDGTNDGGQQLPDGLYYVKCKVNDNFIYVKVMFVK